MLRRCSAAAIGRVNSDELDRHALERQQGVTWMRSYSYRLAHRRKDLAMLTRNMTPTIVPWRKALRPTHFPHSLSRELT